MRTQEVLFMVTEKPTLRSDVVGWTAEDSNLYVRGKPIGLSPGPSPYPHQETVLEALADGYKMLAPPEEHTLKYADDGPEVTEFHWWLVR